MRMHHTVEALSGFNQHNLMFPTLLIYVYIYCSMEIFDRKYFIDKKFKVKYFRGCITSLKYFYLEHILLAIIYAH